MKNMKGNNDARIHVNKKLMDTVKEKYPETTDLTYTGLVTWALRKLIGG